MAKSSHGVCTKPPQTYEMAKQAAARTAIALWLFLSESAPQIGAMMALIKNEIEKNQTRPNIDVALRDAQFVNQVHRQEGHEHRVARRHKNRSDGQKPDQCFPIGHLIPQSKI